MCINQNKIEGNYGKSIFTQIGKVQEIKDDNLSLVYEHLKRNSIKLAEIEKERISILENISSGKINNQIIMKLPEKYITKEFLTLSSKEFNVFKALEKMEQDYNIKILSLEQEIDKNVFKRYFITVINKDEFNKTMIFNDLVDRSKDSLNNEN